MVTPINGRRVQPNVLIMYYKSLNKGILGERGEQLAAVTHVTAGALARAAVCGGCPGSTPKTRSASVAASFGSRNSRSTR